MRNRNIYAIIACLAVSIAWQPVQAQETAGKVMVGEFKGNGFSMATGNEGDLMMEIIEAFNDMNAAKLWEHSADTVNFLGADGVPVPLTEDAMAGLFATMDSVKWEVMAVIPVQVVGSEYVNIFVDGYETLYPKGGDMEKKRLMERFLFKDEKLLAIYQWTGALREEAPSE